MSVNDLHSFAPWLLSTGPISLIVCALSGFSPCHTFNLPACLLELGSFADPVQIRFLNYVEGLSGFELENVLCSFPFSHFSTPLPHFGQLVIVAIGKSATDTALIVIVPLLVSGRVNP